METGLGCDWTTPGHCGGTVVGSDRSEVGLWRVSGDHRTVLACDGGALGYNGTVLHVKGPVLGCDKDGFEVLLGPFGAVIGTVPG